MGQELEAARAEVAQIRKEQDSERARVKKAMMEMRRKMDGCVERGSGKRRSGHAGAVIGGFVIRVQRCTARPPLTCPVPLLRCVPRHRMQRAQKEAEEAAAEARGKAATEVATAKSGGGVRLRVSAQAAGGAVAWLAALLAQAVQEQPLNHW